MILTEKVFLVHKEKVQISVNKIFRRCFPQSLYKNAENSVISCNYSNLISPVIIPVNIYLFKVNNKNIRKKCQIYQNKDQNNFSDVLVFLLLTLKIFYIFF